MRFIVLSFVFVLSILLLGCSGTDNYSEPTTLANDGPYTHEITGIIFPSEVSSFYRSDITQFDSKGKDISCSYKLPYLSSPVTVSVYVYPAEHLKSNNDPATIMSQLQVHADKISDELSGYYSEFKIISKDPAILNHNGTTHNGVSIRYQYEQDVGLGLRDYMSYLYLFHNNDCFVKYRATFPIEQLDKIDPHIQNFLDELKW
ncbi:MAG: hypothetical protein HQ553_03625 [Chloroflexi bacterium]|nr:hypothetical protein [Chloroflexota bacterium]